MSETKKNKGGRPPVNATPITVRIPPDLLSTLDSNLQKDESRPEAIRRILKDWLTSQGYFK